MQHINISIENTLIGNGTLYNTNLIKIFVLRHKNAEYKDLEGVFNRNGFLITISDGIFLKAVDVQNQYFNLYHSDGEFVGVARFANPKPSNS